MASSGTSKPRTAPESPYRGLLPFTESDQKYFFGREQDTETILANLLTTPLSVLYGASGVGKSSVLLAGVVPALREMPDVIVVVFRTWQHADLSGTLNRLLLAAVDSPPQLSPDLRFDEFLDRFGKATGRHIVFIFDQFEEYFLYHEADSATEGFETWFARAVNRADVEANFLLSLREDGLSKLDRFRGRLPNLLSNLIRLEHLDAAGAEAAIRRPLEVYNAEHAGEPPIRIEDSLVRNILIEVQTGRFETGPASGHGSTSGGRLAAAARIEAPFLQMVLLRLWNEELENDSRTLRQQTFLALGNAQNIVRTHLDRAMQSLTPAEKDAAAAVFHYLVTPSGSKVAYTVEDLAAYAEIPKERLGAMLEKLCHQDLRILRQVSAPPELRQPARFEIFHDVLAAPVLDWRLRHRARRELEARLERERAVMRTGFAWTPWVAGYFTSLLTCGVLPIGAFVVHHMLKKRSPQSLMSAIRTARRTWLFAWLPAVVLYGLCVQLLPVFLDVEDLTESSEDVVLGDYINFTLLLVRATIEPLVARFFFSRAARRAMDKESHSQQQVA